MAEQSTSGSTPPADSAAGARVARRERFRLWRGGKDQAAATSLAGEPSGAGRDTGLSTDHLPAARVPAGESSGTELALANARVTSVEGDRINVSRSFVGRLRSRRVDLRQGGAALALGRNVRLRQGGAAILAGGRLTVEQGGGQWLIGGLVQARQVFAIAVIAGKVEGQVRCLFDARGAFAFGAGIALVTGLLRHLTRRK